mmetsp:Transcript_11252/g.14188  ORF Transcript_11252/g.14188 Transcript_11252/m.14188 type:complete len:359 (+) Transcript_11252:304-1380(+)|eukprot:CAMPEP_0203710958 /NCGR_PEP_ID=MMETSP0091-20130426/67123_1 /ASSEMBLY_ACC=CAM_ASM_001089 /TAXON_ID=426623 /ORGANISM="Chaetoceros affinis, Strain CCMP159" /LENGTH=358 /DNA_ID=CAMNT_0050588619 /DNA_START=229 /DNA_END=1305 /DNA_ORIENTATION=-
MNNIMWILTVFAILATFFSAAFVYQKSSSYPTKTVTPLHDLLNHQVLARSTQQLAPRQTGNHMHLEMELHSSTGGARYLTRSPPFQIKSKTKLSTPSGEEIDLCVEIKEPGVESDLIIQECLDDDMDNQLWRVDQFGRFHSQTNGDLCISLLGGQVKKCNFNSRNAMSINGFSYSINSRKNGSRYLSYNPNGSAEEVKGSRVGIGGSARQWSIVPSGVFLSKEDLPLDKFFIKLKADQSMCIAASDLKRRSPLVLEPCDASNNMQLWKYVEGGMIKIASSETECIVKGAVSNGDPSLMIGTPCRRLSKNKSFMYDVVTLKIVQVRNNKRAFTVDGDDVVIGFNHPTDNAVQQFVLEAP